MHLYTSIIVLLASLSAVVAQNATLIDPVSRFSHLNLSVPNEDFPVLQSTFSTQPDCGEESYRGTGRLTGLRTLITGGDSGIGRAVAIAFLREGAEVAINYMPEEESDAQALADFVGQEGFSIERIPGNLLNETFCAYVVEEVARRLGGLDILIGNAGYSGPQNAPEWQPIWNHSTTQIEQVFRTNVFANLFLTRAAAPLLPPGGSIIFTSSAMSFVPYAQAVDYGATKAAINHMTASLAQQMAARGVRVNAVAPAAVYTPFLAAQGTSTEALAEGAATAPFRRVMQPVEVSPFYVHLADPSGTYTSGNVITIGGAGVFH